GHPGRRAPAVSVEHMGRETAMNAETIRRRNTLIESERDDAENLGQRRVAFGRGVVAKAVLELAQDRSLAVPAHADDEGHAELFAIGIVEPVERGEFVRRESVEPRARLLVR